MTHFVIDSDNAVTAYTETPTDLPDSAWIFSTVDELIAFKFNGRRLVEIWNSIPGHEPIKAFMSTTVGAKRIWKAIQQLASSEATTPVEAEVVGLTLHPALIEPIADGAPAKAPKARKASKSAPKGSDAPRAAKPAKEAKPAREGSRTDTILGMIRSENGATLAAIMAATGWQAHSVRGFISGVLGKKMGIVVESTKTATGERTYRVAQ